MKRLSKGLAADPQVARVDFQAGNAQHVDPTGRYLNVQVIGESDYGKPESLDFVDRLRADIVPAAGFPAGVTVVAGGGPPGGRDFLDLTYSWFPWLVLAVLLATYVLLVRAFRSLLLPLKAIILNCLSIGAAYGLMVVVFKWGWGEPFGLIAYDQIEGWIPVMLFAMLFGLSMDYEVFLVSRMREEWDAGASNEEAVVVGLEKTGRLVTAAGPDHGRRVHGVRGRLDRRAAAVRLRPRGGDPDRRHDRPLAARAVGDEALRPLQLVAAGGRGADRARRPVAARRAQPGAAREARP